jgi:hypothetical protein
VHRAPRSTLLLVEESGDAEEGGDPRSGPACLRSRLLVRPGCMSGRMDSPASGWPTVRRLDEAGRPTPQGTTTHGPSGRRTFRRPEVGYPRSSATTMAVWLFGPRLHCALLLSTTVASVVNQNRFGRAPGAITAIHSRSGTPCRVHTSQWSHEASLTGWRAIY